MNCLQISMPSTNLCSEKSLVVALEYSSLACENYVDETPCSSIILRTRALRSWEEQKASLGRYRSEAAGLLPDACMNLTKTFRIGITTHSYILKYFQTTTKWFLIVAFSVRLLKNQLGITIIKIEQQQHRKAQIMHLLSSRSFQFVQDLFCSPLHKIYQGSQGWVLLSKDSVELGCLFIVTDSSFQIVHEFVNEGNFLKVLSVNQIVHIGVFAHSIVIFLPILLKFVLLSQDKIRLSDGVLDPHKHVDLASVLLFGELLLNQKTQAYGFVTVLLDHIDKFEAQERNASVLPVSLFLLGLNFGQFKYLENLFVYPLAILDFLVFRVKISKIFHALQMKIYKLGSFVVEIFIQCLLQQIFTILAFPLIQAHGGQDHFDSSDSVEPLTGVLQLIQKLQDSSTSGFCFDDILLFSVAIKHQQQDTRMMLARQNAKSFLHNFFGLLKFSNIQQILNASKIKIARLSFKASETLFYLLHNFSRIFHIPIDILYVDDFQQDLCEGECILQRFIFVSLPDRVRLSEKAKGFIKIFTPEIDSRNVHHRYHHVDIQFNLFQKLCCLLRALLSLFLPTQEVVSHFEQVQSLYVTRSHLLACSLLDFGHSLQSCSALLPHSSIALNFGQMSLVFQDILVVLTQLSLGEFYEPFEDFDTLSELILGKQFQRSI